MYLWEQPEELNPGPLLSLEEQILNSTFEACDPHKTGGGWARASSGVLQGQEDDVGVGMEEEGREALGGVSLWPGTAVGTALAHPLWFTLRWTENLTPGRNLPRSLCMLWGRHVTNPWMTGNCSQTSVQSSLPHHALSQALWL